MLKTDPTHWVKGGIQIATEETCSLPWNCGEKGIYFRCHLCGHKFIPGDQWRFIFGKNKCMNILVCKDCDGSDEDLRDKFSEITKKYRWIWEGRL